MTEVFFDWLASLYKSEPKDDIDPFSWKCVCGHKWHFNKWQLLRMFLFKNYTYTCPQCHRKSRYRMITHVIRDKNSKEIDKHNRMLEQCW